MATGALLGPIAALLNRNLAASTPARGLCAGLAGRSCAVLLRGPELRLRLAAEPDALSLAVSDAPADATVAGTPLALARLLKDGSSDQLNSGALSVSGDPDIAQGFARLLHHLRPDFEGELARLVGDVPAYYAGTFARQALRFTRGAAASLAQSAAEYLREERRDVVARAELESYLSGVDQLRDAVDRAQARIELLAARRGNPG
jgi:ubiquinone biosynthesis accessory factor UbiJ